MKQEFRDFSEISIAQITARHTKAYRDYWLGLSAPAHFSGIMQGRDQGELKTFTDLFDAIGGKNVLFGLWYRDKIIGQTALFFDKFEGQDVAIFQGSEISDDYRGYGLAAHLYDARMRYLKEIGYEGRIITSIRAENEPSMHVAQKNGFRRTDKTIYDKVILEHDGVDIG